MLLYDRNQEYPRGTLPAPEDAPPLPAAPEAAIRVEQTAQERFNEIFAIFTKEGRHMLD